MNEACRWSLVTWAIERSVRLRVFGSTNGVVASDFMPSRTAMSTTSGTPVNSSSLTNAVFGDVASASCSDICVGVVARVLHRDRPPAAVDVDR